MDKIGIKLLILIFAPFVLNGQIQGPSQPEFTGFSSINNQELVNENTGDLNYGIPILTIPGENGFNYELKLSYNSDFAPDDEASWVGWGWNLNIGSITRIKNGFPDDFNNIDVAFYNEKPDNISINLTLPVGAEIYSIHSGVELQQNFHYNSLNGYYLSSGFGLSAYKGIGNINFGFDKSGNLSGSYSFDLSPSVIYSTITSSSLIHDLNYGGQNSILTRGINKGLANTSLLSGIGFSNSNLNFNSVPTSLSGYETTIRSARFTMRPDAFPKIGVDVGISGNYIKTEYVGLDVKKVYGYMHSDVAENVIESYINQGEFDALYDSKIKMDYSLDRTNPFSRRDYFLSVPVSSPDEFIVQAEGLSGGFRYQFENPINFYPEPQNNKIKQGALGGSFNYAAFPIEYGVGFQVSTDVHGRNQIDPEPIMQGDGNNYGSFIFHNDKALHKSFDPKLNKANIDNDEFDFSSIDLETKSKKSPSNFIEYSTIGSEKFNKNLHFLNFESYEDLISEFRITNTNGIKYTFGQPVFSRNENIISYGIKNEKSNKVQNNFIYPFRISESEVNQKYGNSIISPYANSFLLTEIYDPHYSDADNDGATIDDAGNYVKFGYSKITGYPLNFAAWFIPIKDNLDNLIVGNDKRNEWNQWRVPYYGYNFSKNELARTEDNLFSFSDGEKELYYPKIIKTKTHIAIFINNKTNRNTDDDITGEEQFTLYMNGVKINTNSKIHHLLLGSDSEREDNLPANYIYNNIENSLINPDLKKMEKNPHRKLEKILLFSIDRERELSETKFETKLHTTGGFINLPTHVSKKPIYYVKELIQVVNFETDYELRENTINSVKIDQNSEKGKLTLKKVWTDYKDVIEAQVSPFEFDYKYPTTTDADYPPEFNYLDNYGSSLIENPDYSIYQTNAWNYYQNDDETKLNNLDYSVNQINNITYDPAAWRLKRIITPSQGEIHIQYDQKDYSTVQNRIPMIMAKLESYDDNNGNGPYRYRLDLSDYYQNLTPSLAASLVEKLRYEFTNLVANGKNKKIYGKFLYNYLNDENTDINDCHSEYLDGFVNVDDIVVNPPGSTNIEIILTSDYFRDICLDLFKNTKNGLDCQTNNNTFFKPVIDAYNIIISNIKNISWGAIDNNSCLIINPELSYFRIPMFEKDKLSGGARVKRVLFYDKFNKENESDNATLYGSEYIYKTTDGKSSGVASNEPTQLGMENVLLDLFELRRNQTAAQNFINGIEKDQNYGNLAKHILPSPKINYSHIIKRRIGIGNENGNSNSFDGFSISEYFTYKDFPFDYKYGLTNSNGKEFNSINYTDLQKEEYTLPIIPNPFVTVDYATFSASQGYLFVKNNINGLLKSKRIYNGDYLNSDSWYLKYSKEIQYSSPGECLPLFEGFNYEKEFEQQPLKIVYSTPGVEIESITESKNILEKSSIFTGFVDLDWVISIFPPGALFLPSGYASINTNYRKLSTSVNSTNISFTPVIKSIKETKDGVVNTFENLIYDSKTGNPILTRTTDEFDKAFDDNDGGIYTYKFPASYFYPTFNKSSAGISNSASTTWEIFSIPRAYSQNAGYFNGFDHIILKDTQGTEYQNYFVGDKVNVDIGFVGVFQGERAKTSLKGVVHSIGDRTIRVQLTEKGNYPFDKFAPVEATKIRISKGLTKRSNRLNEIADNVVIYGAENYFTVCNSTLPDHFDIDYLYTNQNSTFTQNLIQPRGLANHINGEIQDRIQNSNYTESIINLDTFNLEMDDIINGSELISDTSKVQYSLKMDPSIDQVLPFDSISVDLIINQKNDLGASDTVYNHRLVDKLNDLLNSLWSKDISSLIEDESLFYQCSSNDSTGSSIDNYFIGVLDSLETDTVDLFKHFKDEYFNVFNQDSNRNILTSGQEILINEDTSNTLFISSRDIDTNYILNDKRVSFYASSNIRFKSDTNSNYFNLGHQKYIRPNQLLSTDFLSFDNDCRDTSLLNFNFIQSDWDTAFIVLPGVNTTQEKIYFPQNDSLFNYLLFHDSFTKQFGYFSIDNNGTLFYNTIGSDYGYSSTSQTSVMNIFMKDTNKYQDINKFTFIVDPSQPLNPVDIDTSQGGSLVIKNTIGEPDVNRLPKSYIPVFPKISANNVLYANTKTYSEPVLYRDYKDVRPNTCCFDLQYWYVNYLKGEYYYNQERIYGNTKKYNNGYYNDFVLFNHFNLNDNSLNWRKRVNQKVNQNNDLIEIQDINGINSTQLLNSLGQPKAIFYDAMYDDVFFESFEKIDLATNTQITTNTAHNGKNSIRLIPSTNSYSLIETDEYGNGLKASNQIIERGLNIKLWAKIDGTNIKNLLETEFKNPVSLEYRIGASSTVTSIMNKVTQTGDWSLFETNIPSTEFTSTVVGEDIEIDLSISPSSPSIQFLYIDDVVLNPTNSKSSCYVYDNSNNLLLATLDENHFSSRYQYNSKGDLIRRIVETFEGVKTIADAQYNAPLIDRPVDYEDLEETSTLQGVFQSRYDERKDNVRVSPSELIDFENGLDPTKVGTNFDVLDIKISSDSTNLKFLDFIKQNSGQILKKSPQLDSISPPNFKNIQIDSLDTKLRNKKNKIIPKSKDNSQDIDSLNIRSGLKRIIK
jgi:hypothetical protein